ncbi:MAG: AsmA family protein, partial [Pseudomonadota bacterium]|nr:AsmA family protein [Pseudomonadota bacterium]
MRVLFYTILITLGLSLSVVILVPSFFDLNTYKPKLYKLVKSKTGFDLEIKGSIGLSILPRLNLNADNVILSDKKETLFRAKNLNIYLSLYSLLKGNLSFDDIKLDTAKIFIKKNSNNSFNWEIKEPEKKDSKQSVINENKTNNINKNNRNLVIKNLYLSNTAVEYQDKKKIYNLDKIFINLKQNTNNNYNLNGSLYYTNKELSFNYNAQILKNTIAYDGEINSEIYSFNNSGKYNISLNEGTIYLDGSLKNLKQLTNINDLKIDELDVNTKIVIDKNNLNFESLKIYNKEANLFGKGKLKINKNNIHLFIDLNSNYLN